MNFELKKKLFQPDRFKSYLLEFKFGSAFSSFVAGTITGIIGVVQAISFAALIFSGSLAGYLNVGVGMAIFSSAVISIVLALTSSLPGMIANPLAAPIAVLAILATQIANTLATESTSNPEVLMTVVAAIALGSVLTGATLWVVGTVRGGNALQFIPYPVVGGFMAAAGWLLVRGAVQVMTGEPLTFANLAWFIELDPALHWGTGLIIALVLLIMTNQFHHSLIMPGILLAVTGFFYGAVWQSDLPLSTIRDQGWLLEPFPVGKLWQPLTRQSLGQVHWDIIIQHSDILGLLVFVSLLSLVLTNGGIELALGQDLDLNRELRALGMANLAAGLGSTLAGNQALPSTLLVYKMGAASRLTGLFKALPCIVVLFLGPDFLAYFPKPILGSLLLFLGLDLLWQWLYKIWFTMAWDDYLTILVTLVLINWVGFMVGIVVGFCMTAIQFLYTCTQMSPIELEGISQCALTYAGADNDPIRTKDKPVKTPAGFNHTLGKLEWIDLQGFLFFGNATFLFQKLRTRIFHLQAGNAPDGIVLNFQSVLGIDASAVLSFNKLLKLAQDEQFTLVYNQVSEPLQKKLIRGQGLDLESDYCVLWQCNR